jgi:hypothetical protein
MVRKVGNFQSSERNRARREETIRRRGKEEIIYNRNGKGKIAQRTWTRFGILPS